MRFRTEKCVSEQNFRSRRIICGPGFDGKKCVFLLMLQSSHSEKKTDFTTAFFGGTKPFFPLSHFPTFAMGTRVANFYGRQYAIFQEETCNVYIYRTCYSKVSKLQHALLEYARCATLAVKHTNWQPGLKLSLLRD